jgi:hypothetical protein
MTTPDQLREIVDFLQQRVKLAPGDDPVIVFTSPDVNEMISAGLDGPTARRLLTMPWWPEMVDDIIETPEYAEADEDADQVLGYARDVLLEYVRKRFPLNP